MLKTKTIDGVLYQECTKCGEWKAATIAFFPPCKTGKNGIRGQCWACRKKSQSEYYKKYHIKNKEKSNEQCRVYSNNNKEKLKIYRKAHPQTYKHRPYGAKEVERQRVYYAKNTEKVLNRKRDYRESHKEEHRMYFKRNRVKRKMKSALLPATLTLKQWERIKTRFNNCCAYCGAEKPLHQEHFVALSNGGEYTHNNIIPACKSCNSSKGLRSFFEWYPKHKTYSKEREKIILAFLSYKQNIQQLSISL